MNNTNIIDWTVEDVINWAQNRENLDANIIKCIECEKLNGKCMLIINEYDLHDVREKCKKCYLKLGDVKLFWLAIRNLQRINHEKLTYLGFTTHNNDNHHPHLHHNSMTPSSISFAGANCSFNGANVSSQFHSDAHHHHHHYGDLDRISPPISIDGRATSIQPEFFKTMISLGE